MLLTQLMKTLFSVKLSAWQNLAKAFFMSTVDYRLTVQLTPNRMTIFRILSLLGYSLLYWLAHWLCSTKLIDNGPDYYLNGSGYMASHLGRLSTRRYTSISFRAINNKWQWWM